MTKPWEIEYEQSEEDILKKATNAPTMYMQPNTTANRRREKLSQEMSHKPFTPESTALAAATGLVRGGTAGMSVYPEAGVKSLIRNKPYIETLKDVRTEDARLQEAHPYAFGGGQVLGNIGLSVLSGATSIPAQAATQGAIGGVSRYTGSEESTLRDAAESGALSATVAATLGLSVRAVDALLRTRGVAAVRELLDRIAKNPSANATKELEKILSRRAGGEMVELPSGRIVKPDPSVLAEKTRSTAEGLSDTLRDIGNNIKPDTVSRIFPGASRTVLSEQTMGPGLQNTLLSGGAGGFTGWIGGNALNLLPYFEGEKRIDPLSLAALMAGGAAGSRVLGSQYINSPRAMKIGNAAKTHLPKVGAPGTSMIVTKTPPESAPWDIQYED